MFPNFETIYHRPFEMNKYRNNVTTLPAHEPFTTTYKKSTLANGIRIISEEVPTVQSFSLGVWIDVGARDEQPLQAGIAHFTEHAVFRGTTSRSSKQIASQFESLGAYINAFTSKEQTCYYVRALSHHFEKTVELVADVTMNPAFRAEDIRKERNVILEEIKSYDDEPEEFILDIGEKSVFGKHALGNPIIGYAGTVKNITATQLHDFHTSYYTPDNIVIAIAGNISHSNAVAMVERFFGKYKRRRKAVQHKRTLPRMFTPKHIETERTFQQSHLLLIRRTFGAQSKQRYALSLLNTILGDGMSSRLHQRIREKSASAYTVYSSLQLLTDCGILSIYAGTETATLQRTETLIAAELQKLITDTIPARELQRAKEQLKSSTIMALESMSARMQTLAKMEMEEGAHEDVMATIAAIDAVTLQDMKYLAEQFCTPETWSVVKIIGKG